jgi:hypothetical protein
VSPVPICVSVNAKMFGQLCVQSAMARRLTLPDSDPIEVFSTQTSVIADPLRDPIHLNSCIFTLTQAPPLICSSSLLDVPFVHQFVGPHHHLLVSLTSSRRDRSLLVGSCVCPRRSRGDARIGACNEGEQVDPRPSLYPTPVSRRDSTDACPFLQHCRQRRFCLRKQAFSIPPRTRCYPSCSA